jgi:hypothetical protein
MMPLLAAALGAMIALTSTLLAEFVRARRERVVVLDQVRYESYLGFMLAIQRANDLLRTVPASSDEPAALVAAAMRDSGLYDARERLLVTGAAEMVLISEAAFRSMLKLRDAAAQGTPLTWPDYHPATDSMAKIAWALRQAARKEFHGVPLNLEQIAAVPTADIADRISTPAVPAVDVGDPQPPRT